MVTRKTAAKRRTSLQSDSVWSATKSIFLKAIGAGPAATVTICVTSIVLATIWTLGSSNLTIVLLKILDNYLLGVFGWLLFLGSSVILNLNRRRHVIEIERVTEERNRAQSHQIPVSSSAEKPTLKIGDSDDN